MLICQQHFEITVKMNESSVKAGAGGSIPSLTTT